MRCGQKKHRDRYCRLRFPSRTNVDYETVSTWARTIDPVQTIHLSIVTSEADLLDSKKRDYARTVVTELSCLRSFG